MFNRLLFIVFLFSGFSSYAASIDLQGMISNSAGKPVTGAIVTLVRQAMKDTTGADGKFSFGGALAAQLPAITPQTENITMARGVVQFTLKDASPLRMEVFDVKGTSLNKVVRPNAPAGVYRFDIGENYRATGLLIIRAAIGNREMAIPYMPLNPGTLQSHLSARASSGRGILASIAAVVDTIKVAATGFQAKAVAITTYQNQQQNISLDSGSTGLKNPPGPSVGCGKDLGSLKSGTYTITSAGLSRKYIIDIPAGYDKNTPYRLIFAMHCYNSTMQGVANEKFYMFKQFATDTKTPCIFVAPNGTGSETTPLWDKGEKDHAFFDDMLKLFKEELCVDTTRVFSSGFSYGAMFTYSLSLNHQKQLRAVATFAPANWNIWLPTDKHEPIAYFQTTGTDDPNCKYIYDDAKQQGGKYCVLGHVTDNGCTAPATIPLATTNKHVSTEFSGCKEGYPVKFGSFKGQHAWNNTDGGSNVDWIPKEAWEFFMRF